MIPVRLELKDFLSYGDPDPIDFTGFEVACLTGPNGMGKSSLLDAMTWALFGAARGCEGGQNQDRLIREGADETVVTLVFELGDETYRVTRSRSRSGRADLRFCVRSGDGWTTIGDDTLRGTETKISEVLRMDYRTFVASAFFLQGRADEFLTQMTPERRKEVFARLLDLGVYERLEEAARARARAAETRRREQTRIVEELSGVTEEADALGGRLDAAREKEAEAEGRLDTAEKDLEAAREELAELERVEALAEQRRAGVRDLEARLVEQREALRAKEAELAGIDELLGRAPEVEGALAEAERVRASEAELREAAERRAGLERRVTELAGRLDAERQEVASRVRAREERAAEVAEELERLDGDGERLEELDEQLESLGGTEGALEQVRGQLADLREEDGSLGTRLAELERRGEELRERTELLEAGEGSCPICGGPLDDAHRSELLEAGVAEERSVAEELERCRARREAVRKEGRRLREEEDRLKRSAEETRQLSVRRGEVAAALARIPGLREEAERLRAAAEADRRLLDEGRVAPEVAGDLEVVRRELEGCPYDREEHHRLRSRLEELRGAEVEKGRIDEAAERRGRVVSERERHEERIEAAKADLERRRSELAEVDERLDGLERARRRTAEAQERVERLRRERQELASEVAKLVERHAALERDRGRLTRARETEAEAAREHRLATRLVKAFGRGGIPDRIIENALPELTEDANEILGRLTDYEMSVAFAMDRPTKSGTIKETFDVLVHHEGGVRDFQMFSGGEAFRIAFSIRMALSKLLVRRAGARLETLVVDEGFGTQDPEGRERLVEAINLARGEFRKVLVITHLDELKDAFGAQLRISKDPRRGSSAALLAP